MEHTTIALQKVPDSVLRVQFAETTTDQVSPQERLQTVIEILATLHEHAGFYETATAFVAELAMRLAGERVSVGFVRGRRVHLAMISPSGPLDKKTNLTRAIEDAMDEVLDQEAVIVYPPMPDATFQITRRHEELARQYGGGAICSVPLHQAGKVCGVLTVERAADKPFATSTVELCEAIAALAGPLLELQRREQRWLLTKVAEALRTHLTHLLGPRHVTLKLASLGLAIVITFFAVVQADYRVAATTRIEAQTQRVAVAPFDGYIADARVRAGDLIQAGDVLCTLDDRNLKLERLKWQSQKDQYVKQYHLAMAQRDAAQVNITKAQIAQAAAELALVEDQMVRTQVRAPFDGVIVTGDLSQSIGAPVERGDMLFVVAPLDTYRVILQVDERDIAEVHRGQHGNLVLSAVPTQPLMFVVDTITPVSIAREGRNYFRVEAQVHHTPSYLRPGMEGVSKIDIDRRLLLWNWTHRAMDWLRLLIWSWRP